MNFELLADDGSPEVVPHGGLDYRDLAARGWRPDDVLDFSTNVNPFGPAPSVLAAVRQAAVDRYPDRECVELRSALSERHQTSPDEWLVGNGGSELLWLIGLAFVRPGDAVLIPQPTYGEYRRIARLREARVLPCSTTAAERFRFPIDTVAQLLEQAAPRVCFLCRPNNPTGTLLPLGAIEEWGRRFRRTLFVVDEAYLDFLPHVASAITLRLTNMLVVRSLGKAHALAGLRIGCVQGDPDRLELLRRVQPPWSVSGPAQAAAVAALRDEHHLRQSLERLAAARLRLLTELLTLGLRPLDSETPFFLVQVGAASAVRAALWEQRILVRECTSFGLPEYVRISPRQPQENAVLVDALRQWRG
jgi:histidinol-phosphate aminotransferase